MAEIINSGVALDSTAVAKLSSDDTIDIIKTVAQLEQKHVFGRDGKGDIAYAYPVSARPTQHMASLKDGRDFYAMCAIDSLGCAFTFEQDAHIKSSCSYCNQPIAVNMQNQELLSYFPPDLRVARYNSNTVKDIHVDR